MNMRAWLAPSVVLVSMLAALPASGADVQACLGASEKGQRARTAGRLREARDQFLVCGGETCPAMVRRDCAQWQSEIIAMLPSVVFGAKDKQGRDLFDVTVSMDGETLLKKLDGKSVNVDPGPHTFKFEVAGAPAVIERALVKEGEKTRVITVSFNETGGAGAVTSTDGGASSAPEPDHTVRPARDSGGHTVFPWIVVGAGVATVITGVVVLALSPALPAGCNAVIRACTRDATESAADLTARQQEAGRSESQPTEGFIIGAIGLGVVAGGLLWHFLEPSADRRGSLQITAWTTRTMTGASLTTSF
jgi:hypothetical protein